MIDFHAHVRRDPVTRTYLAEELLEDQRQNGIRLRVVSAMEGASISEQNQYISRLVCEHPRELAGFAVINPKAEDAVEEARRAAALPGVCGFEFNSFEHGYFPERCPNLDAVLDVAEAYRFPVKTFTGSGATALPRQWAAYAERRPSLTFVMLHMGRFDFGYGCIEFAKRFPNILLETSDQYEAQILRKAFRELPPEKFLFGTHYPNTITRCCVDAFQTFALPEPFRRKLFGENAKRVLGREA
jgi:predicted TIM-barrel fold metal-dependent hydrolase